MNSFFDSMLGHRMADAIIRLANKLTTETKQYCEYCSKDEAHSVISCNLKKGNRFIAVYESSGYCTLIFEEKEQ